MVENKFKKTESIHVKHPAQDLARDVGILNSESKELANKSVSGGEGPFCLARMICLGT